MLEQSTHIEGSRNRIVGDTYIGPL